MNNLDLLTFLQAEYDILMKHCKTALRGNGHMTTRFDECIVYLTKHREANRSFLKQIH